MNVDWPTGSGMLLRLIRKRPGIARADLVDELGWSRATVGKRLEELQAHGYISITGQHRSTGGRRAEAFAVNASRGVVLSADIGASHSRLAVADLAGSILIEDEADILIDSGVDEVFEWALQVFDFMLGRLGRTRSDVMAMGIGVPDPVDRALGRIHSPMIRREWGSLSLTDYLARYFPGAVIAVERDANLLALAEHRFGWPAEQNLALVKFSAGLGCGMIIDGEIYQGAHGGAGDIGQITHRDNTGTERSLDELISGRAIHRELSAMGYHVRTSADVVTLAMRGDKKVRDLIAGSAEVLAKVVLEIVRIVSPAVLVVSGTLTETGNLVLGPIIRLLKANELSFPAGFPEVTAARLGRHAGVVGASMFALDQLFDPDRISQLTAGAQGRHSVVAAEPHPPRRHQLSGQSGPVQAGTGATP